MKNKKRYEAWVLFNGIPIIEANTADEAKNFCNNWMRKLMVYLKEEYENDFKSYEKYNFVFKVEQADTGYNRDWNVHFGFKTKMVVYANSKYDAINLLTESACEMASTIQKRYAIPIVDSRSRYIESIDSIIEVNDEN